jgi:membrane associated rhomboid family serine protease
VHCVDCVRAAAASGRSGTTVFGGRVRGGRPVVTFTLIGLSVLSFLLQRTVPGWTDQWYFSPVAGYHEPWRFLTAAFLHSPGSLLHIGFNMYALWILGQFLEPALGRWRFLALYLTSALGGSVGVLLLATSSSDWFAAVVGASGAVFGLFGAVLVALRRLGRDATQIVVVLVINAVLGFVIPGIAWQAHLGGLLTGLALGGAFAYAPRGNRRTVGVVAVAVVAVLLVVLALAKYATT